MSKLRPQLPVYADVNHTDSSRDLGIVLEEVTVNVLGNTAWEETRKNSELFYTCQSLFVSELAPPTPATLYRRQSYGQSRDSGLVLEEAMDSGASINHVTLNMSADNAWEETTNRTTIKSTLMDFFPKI